MQTEIGHSRKVLSIRYIYQKFHGVTRKKKKQWLNMNSLFFPLINQMSIFILNQPKYPKILCFAMFTFIVSSEKKFQFIFIQCESLSIWHLISVTFMKNYVRERLTIWQGNYYVLHHAFPTVNCIRNKTSSRMMPLFCEIHLN